MLPPSRLPRELWQGLRGPLLALTTAAGCERQDPSGPHLSEAASQPPPISAGSRTSRIQMTSRFREPRPISQEGERYSGNTLSSEALHR